MNSLHTPYPLRLALHFKDLNKRQTLFIGLTALHFHLIACLEMFLFFIHPLYKCNHYHQLNKSLFFVK